MAGMLVGMAILLINSFWPFPRRSASASLAAIAPYIAAATLLITLLVLVILYRNFSLRTKMVVGFLIASLLPMIIVGYASNYLTQSALVKNANELLLASASQTAGSLDAFVLDNLDTVRTEAQLQDFRDYLEMPASQRRGSDIEKRALAALLVFKNRNSNYITSYGLLDGSGMSILDTLETDSGLDKSDRAYFDEPMRTGQPYFGPVEISPALNVHVINVSAPVRNASGVIIGVLRFRYDASILQSQIKQKIGSQYLSLLVNDSYLLLADSRASNLLYKSIAPLNEDRLAELKAQNRLPDLPAAELDAGIPALLSGLQSAGDHPAATFSGTLMNTTEPGSVDQAGVVKMQTRPWHVIIAEPQSILFAPSSQQAHSLLIAGEVVAVLAVGLGFLFAQFLSEPVLRLTLVANRISAGDLSARAEINSRDEIGMLANSMNSMTADLKQPDRHA